MKTITFVTSNKTKLLHAQEALSDMGYKVTSKQINIIEPREEDPEKVAAEKATQAFTQIQGPLMVEDSGIFIRALNGFPKTFVHFALDTIGVANIVKLMAGVSDRYVEFRQALAYIGPGMDEPKIFSYIDGNFSLADKVWVPLYDGGDFDKILIPPGESQPLCMFDKQWRAKRDAAMNQETIHYRQLARWLGELKK